MKTMNATISRYLLRADGAWLALIAAPMLISDLAGAFAGWGPLATVLQTAPHSAIGFVEAHGLALILGIILLRAQPSRGLHVVAGTVHLLLGSANVVFWQLFLSADQLTMGYVTTSFHFLFAILQIVSAWANAPGATATQPARS